MNTLDIRKDNFMEMRARLPRLQREVHAALAAHGPLTTLELAGIMGRSVLTVRPRVTELAGLGLAKCVGRRGRDGVYEAVPAHEAALRQAQGKRGAAEQMLLRIGG